MKYDFTSIIDRKGKDAIAVDILPNMLGPGEKSRSKRRAGLHSDVGCGHEFSGTPEDHRSDH